MSDAPATLAKGRKFRGVVYIDWDRCKGCGFCVEFCPPKALALSEAFNPHGYHPPHLVKEASGSTNPTQSNHLGQDAYIPYGELASP